MLKDGNSIFIFEVAGLCIGHLGHLHHKLDDTHFAAIGRLDIVMVPIDGTYTMSLDGVSEITKRLRASVVLPMHRFATPLDEFMRLIGQQFVIDQRSERTLKISRDTLPGTPTVIILDGVSGRSGILRAQRRLRMQREGSLSEPVQRIIESNGIRLNIAEQGKGPPVILCHGFPESWYSWRHQLTALAAAGFHAVAPDMRGYGKSDRPEAIDQYTIFHLIGDLVGLLDALEAPTAVIVGHDWGAASPGTRRACAPTASAPWPASACHSGLAGRCARPASCRRLRTRNSTSCISSSRA